MYGFRDAIFCSSSICVYNRLNKLIKTSHQSNNKEYHSDQRFLIKMIGQYLWSESRHHVHTYMSGEKES